MRTTVDIYDALMLELQERARLNNASLKDEVNACLERALGMGAAPAQPWVPRSHHMGGVGAEPGKVWDLVDALEAQAYAAKRELGK